MLTPKTMLLIPLLPRSFCLLFLFVPLFVWTQDLILSRGCPVISFLIQASLKFLASASPVQAP